jgi:hypothetical protein
VLADHADVIGHFDAVGNTTPFKSGSQFDRARHVASWRRVAATLGTTGEKAATSGSDARRRGRTASVGPTD